MNDPDQFAARLIEAGAAGYAAAAAERVVDGHPDIAERFGAGAFHDWQDHFHQRLRELATALVAGDPELFTAEVAWSRAAFEGRDVPLSDLRASLECLQQVLVEELPAAAGEAPVRYIELGREALDAETAPAATAPVDGSPEGRLALAYLEATLSGDRRKALDTVLSAVEGGLAVTLAYEALMIAQREVGDMWHAGDLVAAQENLVTSTTQALLTLLADRTSAASTPNGKTVMVAVAPGEAHNLASRLLANLFEQEGWRVIHLAGSLPPSDLALGLEAFEADLLVLSLTLSTHLQATMQAVRLAKKRRPGVKVLVGGPVLARSPGVCQRLGADACATSPQQALTLAATLVGLS